MPFFGAKVVRGRQSGWNKYWKSSQCTDITCKQCVHLLRFRRRSAKIRPFMSAAERFSFAKFIGPLEQQYVPLRFKGCRAYDWFGRTFSERYQLKSAQNCYVTANLCSKFDWQRMVRSYACGLCGRISRNTPCSAFWYMILWRPYQYRMKATTTEKDYPFSLDKLPDIR